jgi:hypothetical protein
LVVTFGVSGIVKTDFSTMKNPDPEYAMRTQNHYWDTGSWRAIDDAFRRRYFVNVDFRCFPQGER